MTIDKNIAPPPAKPRGQTAATLRQMQPGESVLVPSADVPTWRSVARSIGAKVRCRKEGGGHRLWRV